MLLLRQASRGSSFEPQPLHPHNLNPHISHICAAKIMCDLYMILRQSNWNHNHSLSAYVLPVYVMASVCNCYTFDAVFLHFQACMQIHFIPQLSVSQNKVCNFHWCKHVSQEYHASACLFERDFLFGFYGSFSIVVLP